MPANCPIIRHGGIVLGKICETFFALARIAFWTTVRGKTVVLNAGTTLVIHVLLIVVLLII